MYIVGIVAYTYIGRVGSRWAPAVATNSHAPCPGIGRRRHAQEKRGHRYPVETHQTTPEFRPQICCSRGDLGWACRVVQAHPCAAPSWPSLRRNQVFCTVNTY